MELRHIDFPTFSVAIILMLNLDLLFRIFDELKNKYENLEKIHVFYYKLSTRHMCHHQAI